MAFTFTNYAAIQPQSSPFQDMIRKMLSGYEQGTKAGYLRPSLEEGLKEAQLQNAYKQLQNKYYEPNMESQLALRRAQMGEMGARTGLLGEQTRLEHARNQYFPEQLKAQMVAAQLKAQQDQMFNQMLQQRMVGNQDQQMLGPQYNLGEGQAPYGGEQSPFAQPNQPSQPQMPDMGQMFHQQPSNDDLLNKKLFNLDTFTPQYKAYIDSITKNMDRKQAAQVKLDADQAMADFKVSSQAQQDLPVLEKALQSAERMKEIIQARPAFFGHWITPGLFAKRSTDPLSGEFQAMLIPQIAAMEKQLSERGNQLALKTSSQKLPGFDETQQSAMGKMDALIASLKAQIAHSKDLAGGNIVRRGNKRLKLIDGHWYELERGDY